MPIIKVIVDNNNYIKIFYKLTNKWQIINIRILSWKWFSSQAWVSLKK